MKRPKVNLVYFFFLLYGDLCAGSFFVIFAFICRFVNGFSELELTKKSRIACVCVSLWLQWRSFWLFCVCFALPLWIGASVSLYVFFAHFAAVRDCRCCPTVSLLARAFATFLYDSHITLNRWVDFNRIGRADFFSATFLCTSFFIVIAF